MMKKIILLSLMVLVVIFSVSSVCLAEKNTVLVMPKLIGIPFFNAAERGALKAGEDFGVDVIYAGPTTVDGAAQAKMVEDYISRGVDAIFVSPNDAAALIPVIERAKSKGILVGDWDAPLDREVVDYSMIPAVQTEQGITLWELLVKALGKPEGNYIILTGGLDTEGLNIMIDAGLKYAEENYPKLNLLTGKIPTDEDTQKAYTATLDVLRAYPELDGIIALSSPAPIGAAQAIQEEEKKDEIVLVGHALPNDARPFLKSGDLKYAMLFDPAEVAYMTVYLADYVLNGNEIVDGMEVPNVGKITLEEDGKGIIMGPPLVFTAENVDDYDF